MTPKEREVYDNYMRIMIRIVEHLAGIRRYPIDEMITANERMSLMRSFVEESNSYQISEADLEADHQILVLAATTLVNFDAAIQPLLAKNKKND